MKIHSSSSPSRPGSSRRSVARVQNAPSNAGTPAISRPASSSYFTAWQQTMNIRTSKVGASNVYKECANSTIHKKTPTGGQQQQLSSPVDGSSAGGNFPTIGININRGSRKTDWKEPATLRGLVFGPSMMRRSYSTSAAIPLPADVGRKASMVSPSTPSDMASPPRLPQFFSACNKSFPTARFSASPVTTKGAGQILQKNSMAHPSYSIYRRDQKLYDAHQSSTLLGSTIIKTRR